MAEPLTFEVEPIAAPPEEQNIKKEGAAEQQRIDTQAQTQAQSGTQSAQRMGVFATLTLTALMGINHVIGGEPPHIQNLKFEVGSDVDEVIANDIIQTGDRLDMKYLKGNALPDEARLPFMVGLYFMVHNRIGNVFGWLQKRRGNSNSGANEQRRETL